MENEKKTEWRKAPLLMRLKQRMWTKDENKRVSFPNHSEHIHTYTIVFVYEQKPHYEWYIRKRHTRSHSNKLTALSQPKWKKSVLRQRKNTLFKKKALPSSSRVGSSIAIIYSIVGWKSDRVGPSYKSSTHTLYTQQWCCSGNTQPVRFILKRFLFLFLLLSSDSSKATC